jgi:hypothetical protein
MAGWNRSVTGLIINRHAPNSVTPENASLTAQVLNGVGQFAGDLPASVAGFFGGAAAGGGGGVVAAAPTGEAAGPRHRPRWRGHRRGFGFGATPEASRQILLDAYAARDGRIKTWQDAVHVVASSLWRPRSRAPSARRHEPRGRQGRRQSLELGASISHQRGANAAAQVVTAPAWARRWTAISRRQGLHRRRDPRGRDAHRGRGHFAAPKRPTTPAACSPTWRPLPADGRPPWEAMDRGVEGPGV